MRPLAQSLSLSFTLAFAVLAAASEEEQCLSPSPFRLEMRHKEFNGIGYDMGYSSLALFAARSSWQSPYVPFLDVRAHAFNNGKPACNAGFGLRYLADHWIYGAYSFYDYRKTSHHRYSQMGFGVERLGEKLDLRLNAFIPFGRKRSNRYDLAFDHFQGHRALLRQKREFSMSGCSGELGYDFMEICKHVELYSAVGPYYFYRSGQNAIGGQLRANFSFFDILTLQGNGSYDPIFKWIGQAEIGLSIPLGRKAKGKGLGCKAKGLRQKSVRAVDRQEIIVTSKENTYSYAMNPQTMQPYNFIFVNQNSSSQGTFESPYASLYDAEANSSPYDVIYIEPAGIYDLSVSQFTLQANQKLFGSSINQTLPSTLGTVTIPAYTSGLPTLTGGVFVGGSSPSGEMISLADNNEIAGLHLQNNSDTYWVVAGSPMNFSFHNNVIDGEHTNASDYADIFNLNFSSGNILIFDNVIEVVYNNASITTAASISLYNFDGGSVEITGNQIQISSIGSNLAMTGINFQTTSPHAFLVDNNTIQLLNNGTTTGVYYELGSSALATGPISFYGNTIELVSQNTCLGFEVNDRASSSKNIKISSNDVYIYQQDGGAYCDAVYITALSSGSTCSVYSNQLNLIDSSTGANLTGIRLANSSGSIQGSNFLGSNRILLQGSSIATSPNYCGVDVSTVSTSSGSIFFNDIVIMNDSSGTPISLPSSPNNNIDVYNNVSFVD